MSLSFRPLQKVVLVGVLLVGFGIGVSYLLTHAPLETAYAGPTDCAPRYDNGTPVPSGYGAAYNVFGTVHERILHTSCDSSSAPLFTASSSDPFRTMYTYKTGYRWTGTTWVPITFTGTPVSGAPDWLSNGVQTSFSLSALRPAGMYNYIAAYTCALVDGRWQCGCRDSYCNIHLWQLQSFTTPIGNNSNNNPNPVTVSFAVSPLTPVASGTTVNFTWTSSGATSCLATGAWGGALPTSGASSTVVRVASTYTLTCGGTSRSVTVPIASANPGGTGISYWRLPDTPNGLDPMQSWSGTMVAPDGSVYIAGMDHVSNAALYRMRNNTIQYVGDAKSASQSASNWRAGDYVEKFHTRPTWYNNQVYVATMNTSGANDDYLTAPGIRIYSFNPSGSVFTDLSASKTGGEEAKGNIVGFAADPSRGILYANMPPTGDIARYTPASKSFVNLGRPNYQMPYVYPSRFMWVGSNGRLYFSAGSKNNGDGQTYDPAIFNYVYYYDPLTNSFGKTNWQLHERAIDFGQCRSGVCYLMDNGGHVYRYTDSGPTFTYLGRASDSIDSAPTNFTWTFSVNEATGKAYVVTRRAVMYEFDLSTGVSTLIADLKTIEPALANVFNTYGYDAMDANGTFYFAAFWASASAENVLLVGVNPTALKAYIAAN